MAAREKLLGENIAVRVVSMPSWELFDEQDQAYQDSVLLPEVGARVSVEAASPIGWDRYVGRKGVVLGMHSFGLSAPIAVAAEHFGFTVERVVKAAKQAMSA
jgi:transketolase